MANVTKEDVIQFIAGMSVLELSELVKELEDKFGLLFDKLKVGNTKEIVSRTVKPVNVKKEIPELLGREL